MSVFLEQLKVKAAAAQKRLQEATARLQAAQAEHTAATNESNTWNFAIHVEAPREAAEEAARNPTRVADAIAIPKADEPVSVGNPEGEINKTELVRNVLRQHIGGMRPVEVWHALREQIPQRGYVYAILGRLKSRDQVTAKGGKYRLRIPPRREETKPVTTVQ
jgi:hypothetical protein